MRRIIKCKKYGEVKEICGKGMCRKCYNKKWRGEHNEYDKKYHEEHKEKYRKERKEYAKKYRREHGGLPINKNKSCSLFLGVHVAEQVLSKVFKNVKQMPPNNPGFDFKCNKNMKIDVKSSVLHYKGRSLGNWVFQVKKNKVADYFLCIAFDNRKDLNPQHVWLIPGEEVNHLTNTSISKSTLSKWREYEKDVGKVVKCCDTMKN